MKNDLRSEKAKRKERDKEFDKIVTGMTATLIITLFMIFLYLIFWRML